VRRRLFNLAAAVSLVLFVATVALWLRSYGRTDQFGRWRRWEERSLIKEEASGLVSQDGALVAVTLSRAFPLEHEGGSYDPGWRAGGSK
jgi:hypothetical protein